MTDIFDMLGEAAARGVEVTLITNDRPNPNLRFKWQFRNTRDTGIGSFKGAGIEARVYDLDGDASEWTLKRGRTVIAEGGTYSCDPFYHFDACLLEAEAALLAAVRVYRAALETPANPIEEVVDATRQD